MGIELKNVSKSFGKFSILQNVSLRVESGEFLALLGPSGSGKTTLLRILAGLEGADEGEVLFYGEDMTRRKAQERGVGFVFQHYALFRHMTVAENVGFGLSVRPRSQRLSKKAIAEKSRELLKLVQLEWAGDRYPSQLSGGQRQRVALARALAIEPKVLLLDEPFGALDAKVRKELRRWLKRLHDDMGMTSVFVTHDQEEALEVADRVVIMNGGKIEQEGTPDEVYHHPATPFVFNFMGNVNLFHGRVTEEGTVLSGGAPESVAGAGASAMVYVRPHMFDLHHSAGSPESFRARVKHINPAGPVVKLDLVSEWGEAVNVELTHEKFRELGLKKESDVYVTPREMKVFVNG
ncbi:MAG: sulfate ABC transporter ATP-binding protein [Nitrospinae bacterium]|nr:sulfate ABC transporter ATP-binding protein [Nitrospinota bacterium]